MPEVTRILQSLQDGNVQAADELLPLVEAMRHLLIDRAHRQLRAKHGENVERVPLDDVEIAAPAREEISNGCAFMLVPGQCYFTPRVQQAQPDSVFHAPFQVA